MGQVPFYTGYDYKHAELSWENHFILYLATRHRISTKVMRSLPAIYMEMRLFLILLLLCIDMHIYFYFGFL